VKVTIKSKILKLKKFLGSTVIEIKNFLGEKRIRRIKALDGVKFSKTDEEKSKKFGKNKFIYFRYHHPYRK